MRIKTKKAIIKKIIEMRRRCLMEQNQETKETTSPSQKKKKNGPGHLKERNHFDAKDMILLVVMLIVIYSIMTWVKFLAEEKTNAENASQETVVESIQNGVE